MDAPGPVLLFLLELFLKVYRLVGVIYSLSDFSSPLHTEMNNQSDTKSTCFLTMG